MAKLIYDKDGPFRFSTDAADMNRQPKVAYEIPDALAAEIHTSLPRWMDKGFRLLDYDPPAA